jgi:hypothetical protein
MPVSQGSGGGGGGAIGGGGPQDTVADVAHGRGVSAPEPDSAAGATAVGTSPTMTEPAVEASSLWTQPGAATPEIVPEVDTASGTSVATAGVELPGMSPSLRRCSRLTSGYTNHRMYSSESGPTLRKNDSDSRNGVPCSLSGTRWSTCSLSSVLPLTCSTPRPRS